MADPWFKFYPRDWRGDQALRAVSIQARGLWMECLCIMHEATPRGHLLLNGAPIEDDALARMAGVSVDEVRFLMDELRQAGVLSVTRKGIIFSRRMTRDHARAHKGKAAVEKRWKRREMHNPQASDTDTKSDAPNRYPTRDPTTQKPEARSQIVSFPSETQCKKPSGSLPFAEFWNGWPNKRGKQPAEKAWQKLRPDDQALAIKAIGEWWTAWRRQYPNASPILPASWLNQKRWEDEFMEETRSSAKSNRWRGLGRGGNE